MPLMSIFSGGNTPPIAPPLPSEESHTPAQPDLAAQEEVSRQQRLTLSPEATDSLRTAGLEGLREIWRRNDAAWAARGLETLGAPDRVFSGIAADGTYVELYRGYDEDDRTATTFFLAKPSDPSTIHEISETEDDLGFSLNAPPTHTYSAAASDGSRIALTLPTDSYQQKRPGGPGYNLNNGARVATPYELEVEGQSMSVMPIDRALEQTGLSTEPLRPAKSPAYEQAV